MASPGGVRCVWLRHDVGNHRTSGSNLSIAKSTQEGLVLTEAQLVALEKAKTEKEVPWRVRKRDALSLDDFTVCQHVRHGIPSVGLLLQAIPRNSSRKSVGKAIRELGYRPQIDLEEGMEVAEEWARWARYI